MNSPNQFMFQNMLQHWILKKLVICYKNNPDMTFQEFNDLLNANNKLEFEKTIFNVYTLTALGYTQLTYAKEYKLLENCEFEASEYNFKVTLYSENGCKSDKVFKCNEEYENYHNNLKEKAKKKMNSRMDNFILHYMRNSFAHSEFEISDSNEIKFTGNIDNALSYEICIQDFQFEKFMNMLLDKAYGFKKEDNKYEVYQSY